MTDSPVALTIACALLGAALDFVFNGVFKIVWIVIYGPAYVVAANVLSKKLSGTKFKGHSRVAVGALLGGAAVMHLAFTGVRRQVVYSMNVASSNPIVLRSDEWPQSLVVSSDKLAKALAGMTSQRGIPVVIERVVDYGCTRSSRTTTVAGVDILNDPDSRWTWKTDPHAVVVPLGPGYEDDYLLWCRIKFYRGVQ